MPTLPTPAPQPARASTRRAERARTLRGALEATPHRPARMALRAGAAALIIAIGILGTAEARERTVAPRCVVVVDTHWSYGGVTKVTRPDLVGQRFAVVRRTSQRKDEYVPSRDVTMSLGYEAYELRGKAGSYVVRRDYIPGTPAVQPVSYEPGKVDVNWNSVPGQPPVKTGDYILDGPLSALTLNPTRCR